MEPSRLLNWLNQQHGWDYSMLGWRGGLTHGAYEVRGRRGERAILKFGDEAGWAARLRQAQVWAEPLRAAGYPLPRDLASGATPGGRWYPLQEFVVGTPMVAPLSAADVTLLLDLNERQANHCATDAPDLPNWSRYSHDVLFAGASGWTAALRDHSPQTRTLLDDLLAVARPHAAAPLSARDVVHGDFLPNNVLIHGSRVAAVIDFSAIGCGMRALDLARVAVWWHDAMAAAECQRLHDAIAAITTPAERAICLGYAVVDAVAFMIAHHPEVVPTFAAHGATLFPPLPRR